MGTIPPARPGKHLPHEHPGPPYFELFLLAIVVSLAVVLEIFLPPLPTRTTTVETPITEESLAIAGYECEDGLWQCDDGQGSIGVERADELCCGGWLAHYTGRKSTGHAPYMWPVRSMEQLKTLTQLLPKEAH